MREDFNADGKADSLILRDWESPRLLVSGERMTDVTEAHGE